MTLWGLRESRGLRDTVPGGSWFSVSADTCLHLHRSQTGQPEPLHPEYSHLHGRMLLLTVVLCVPSAPWGNCILHETLPTLVPDTTGQGLLLGGSRDIFHSIRMLRALSNVLWNVSRDGASTCSLGNLCHSFTTRSIKNFPLALL